MNAKQNTLLSLSKRRFLLGCSSLGLCAIQPSWAVQKPSENLITGVIPKTGELIPAIGMGTWITFNVGGNILLRQQRQKVLQSFFDAGGKLVDSSPMYGASEGVLGDCLKHTGSDGLFAATKTWTSSKTEGKQQFNDSQALWGVPRFDLLQIHNLLGWQTHLPFLKELKQQGNIRYIGITTSHGRRGNEVKKILQTQEVDFVQLTHNLLDRETERELIPLAREKGVAVICNRPFQGGRLPRITQNKSVPAWAAEVGCSTWPQLLLKYVISTPGVTAAIPATSKVEHMRENMVAQRGELLSNQQRTMALSAFQAL